MFSDGLVKDVISVLEAENQNNAAEFVVKDVQHIGAEVSVSCQFINLMMCEFIHEKYHAPCGV